MADTFPTALQRTSDERWVTLDVVAREDARVIARIAEASDQVAVVHLGDDPGYDQHLRALLSSPPPDAGRDVHMAWPVDLLHDMDARVVGYTVRRTSSPRSFALADFVDPARRAEIAPMSTRRHLLRVARNVATATAALHHAGHGNIRGSHFRVDDRAHVLVVRIDDLHSNASETARTEDERRLGNMVLRLLSGRPWATTGSLGDLLTQAADPGADPVPAQTWFFALRDAEKALPRTPSVASADDHAASGRSATHAAPAEARTAASSPADGEGSRSTTTDLASALRESRERRDAASDRSAPSPDLSVPDDTRADDTRTDDTRADDTQADDTRTDDTRADEAPARGGPADDTLADDRPPHEMTEDPPAHDAEDGPAPSRQAIDIDLEDDGTAPPVGHVADAGTLALSRTDRTAGTSEPDPAGPREHTLTMDVPATAPVAGNGAIRRSERSRRVRAAGRHVASSKVETPRPATSATADPLPPAGMARPLFALAAALTFGTAASVAPFAAFLVVASAMILSSAVNVGRVKATRGPQQTLAIILSRLVPFATGGLALASFILLDLLLLLGLCMALGERLFDYGPGFTLTWILQLPEVPGLVRVFAFAVGAFGGMALGGETYDRIRAGANGRRLIVTPAIALALAAGVLLADAQVVWWPLPLIA